MTMINNFRKQYQISLPTEIKHEILVVNKQY